MSENVYTRKTIRLVLSLTTLSGLLHLLADTSRPGFCPDIRLLMKHTFTGKYSAHHRLPALNPLPVRHPPPPNAHPYHHDDPMLPTVPRHL
ncbi:hypothetical protein BJV78DRAFT_1189649 [Lactifluus subvellereus]|nr:hypothetical protein BJV78DRAFT_1189649 [Lactifluus subvellereus]